MRVLGMVEEERVVVEKVVQSESKFIHPLTTTRESKQSEGVNEKTGKKGKRRQR